jgi:hypothetical protein
VPDPFVRAPDLSLVDGAREPSGELARRERARAPLVVLGVVSAQAGVEGGVVELVERARMLVA